MVTARIIAGTLAAASLVATGLVAPAIGATGRRDQAAQVNMASQKRGQRATRSFTPAAADPRLAALFARGGLDAGSFRFTPAETKANDKSVTVAVRASSNRGTDVALRDAPVTAGTVGLAPIAYNLGVAIGWKRFAVAGEVARVDLAGRPGSRESADVGVSYSLKRMTGRVVAAADRPIDATPLGIAELPSYSLDVGGSYSLTRNLDVTAGVRYRSDRERLARVDDDRRDSQAVYVGTAFRF